MSERLRSIAINAGAPEEALEPALKAILEACGAGAGGVCLFDQRTEMLRLATEFGLSDEGCQRLRSVRRGDAAAWDMPLHGLLNRRAYLIDSASKNRYVPPLVEPATSVRTVACLPLYSGPTPLGSIVLIALAPRMLGERDIRNLEPPLRELVKIIESVRRRSRAAAAAASAGAPAPVKLSGQGTAHEATPAGRGSPSTVPSPAAASPRPASPEPAATALRPVAVDLLSDNPGRAAETGDRSPGEAERVDLLIASLAATERERARLAAALDAERTEHAEQHRTQTALDERRMAERAGEVERLTTRLAAVEEELAGERERVGEWERKFEAMSEELRTAATREQNVREELHAAAERGQAERQQELERALERERVAEEARVSATADAEAARAVAAAAEARSQTLEEELARMRAQERLEAAGAAEGSRTEAQSRIDALEREITALREERDRTVLAMREREAATEAERDALRGLQAELQAERERHAVELAAATATRAKAPSDAAAAAEPIGLETPVPAEAPPAAPTTPPVGAAARRANADRPTIVVLDVDGAWEGLAVAGHRVMVIGAEAAVANHLAALAPARVVVNLAAPGMLAALRSLRTGGCASRFWGCIGAPGTKRAIPLGMVEPGSRPLEADAVLAALGAYATRGTRVVTTGGDVDALMSLRQAMARQGMSVSMAWDAKQAADLLVMVKPQVVVIDLESPREGYSVVAALSAGDPVPHALLIPGSGDPAAGFTPVLADPHYAGRFLPLERLLQNVLRANEAPRGDRR